MLTVGNLFTDRGIVSILRCACCNISNSVLRKTKQKMKFDCSGCGSCCKRVGKSMELLKQIGFPYGTKEDGMTCEKLTEDNKCSVYRNRPDACNVDMMFYRVHSHSGKTKKEVFLNEAKICNSFIEEDKLDKKYLINLKQYQ